MASQSRTRSSGSDIGGGPRSRWFVGFGCVRQHYVHLCALPHRIVFLGVLLGAWEPSVPAHCLRLVLVAVLKTELSGSGFGGSVMMWG